MRYLCTVLVASFLLAPDLGLAQLKTEVSELTNTKRLVSNDMRPLVTQSYPGHASFRAECERPAEGSATWKLSFYGFADAPTSMNEATSVRLQVDGQPVTATRVTSKTRSLDDSIVEIKHAIFTRSAYEQIATADDVIVSIGSARFELTRPLREDLRLLLDRVPAESNRQTAASDEPNPNS